MSEDLKKSIAKVLQQDKDFLVSLTQDMVRIPTVNPKFELNPEINREADFQNFLEPIMGEIGLTTELSTPEALPGRPNLVGNLPGTQGRSLVLCGHVDVVPVGEIEKWTVEPFAANIANDRIYGRGTLDMKGGLAAQVAACRALHKLGIEIEGDLSIHAVVDEEAGGFGAKDLIEKVPVSEATLICEPTWGVINPSEGGLEWVRVTIRGKNAHAGWRYNSIYPQVPSEDRLEPGVNALEYGAMFIMALRELEREWGMNKYHPDMPLGLATINPGVMLAGAGIGEDDRPLITTNPAIIPDTCVMEFDLKFMPDEEKDDVRKEFESFVHHFAQQHRWLRENPPKVTWEIGGLHFPPVNTPADHPLVRSIIANRKMLGHESQVSGFIAVTDAAHYCGKGSDSVIYGPSGDGFHGIDEYIEIDSLIETSIVVANTIIDWCGHK